MRMPISAAAFGGAAALLIAATLARSQERIRVEPTEQTAQRWGVPASFNRETPRAIHAQWQQHLHGYLNTRDGVALRFSVLLPAGAGPFPVVINYSGYDPGAIGGYSYVHDNTAMSNGVDASLLAHGFAVLGVNARGTGCSEGVFDFLGPTYGTDGADIVEWAATQPWSNGSIGMANWSWAGMSQVATASERPPHLKAIVPGMALTDPRLDSWALGGVPSQGFLTAWWMFLHSRWLAVRRSAEEEQDDRCLAQVEKNYVSGETPGVNLPSHLIRHPVRDEWIDEHTLLKHAERIDVPVLSMEAFQDEATTVRAGYYQERLDPEKLWIVQTNGNHDLYESLQFRPIMLDFLEHFVKGEDNGFEKRAHVETWQETTTSPAAPRELKDAQAKAGWVVRREHFPVDVKPLELALSSGSTLLMPGTVAQSHSNSSPDRYLYPVEGPSVDLDAYDAKWGALSNRWREGSIAYATAPLPRDVVIYGPASVNLWISTSVSDTDVQVTLTDVRADGQERFVQRGWLRVSDRALDLARSTPLHPWLCDRPECVQAMSPNVPVLARIELPKTSYAFRKQSRIRIWIDAPAPTGENSFDHSSLASSNAVWHDSTHPSTLVLGELTDVTVPPNHAPCAGLLMQPCRPDPLANSK